ncbi:MAG: hypothetical protein M1817_000819 [Caeruleum heppii]|nr:MAG: hypothetical protein M1817_000819 [Caeruleum heppii]
MAGDSRPTKRARQATGAAPAQDAGTDRQEDWTKVTDLVDRRRLQNRISQRNYRTKIRARLERLEALVGSQEAQQEAQQEAEREARRKTVQSDDGQQPETVASPLRTSNDVLGAVVSEKGPVVPTAEPISAWMGCGGNTVPTLAADQAKPCTCHLPTRISGPLRDMPLTPPGSVGAVEGPGESDLASGSPYLGPRAESFSPQEFPWPVMGGESSAEFDDSLTDQHADLIESIPGKANAVSSGVWTEPALSAAEMPSARMNCGTATYTTDQGCLGSSPRGGCDTGSRDGAACSREGMEDTTNAATYQHSPHPWLMSAPFSLGQGAGGPCHRPQVIVVAVPMAPNGYPHLGHLPMQTGYPSSQ